MNVNELLKNNYVKLAVKVLFGIIIILDLILNIVIIKSSQNIQYRIDSLGWTMDAIDSEVDTIVDDISDIKDDIHDIKNDIRDIEYYLE